MELWCVFAGGVGEAEVVDIMVMMMMMELDCVKPGKREWISKAGDWGN